MERFKPETPVAVETRACPECLSEIPRRGDALRLLHDARDGLRRARSPAPPAPVMTAAQV